ncbi:MAG: hypothetical protein KY464_11875 [Gemmatimonadetes bacterium]|nr:hypothetical protein [Gemmatimonadota bacterium]
MRLTFPTLLLSVAALSGCSSAYGGFPRPGGPLGDIIAVGDDRDDRDDRDGRGGVAGARRLGVPKGHYPPPGECRVWYPGTPPGQQPPPAKCDRLVGRVPVGAFVLYNDREWDTSYDWTAHERRQRGSVPAVILELVRSQRR